MAIIGTGSGCVPLWSLRYVWHDCFILSSPEADFIFDFWRDPAETDAASTGLPPCLRGRDASRPLYVFVSHHHKDHFTRRIFSWQHDCPHIHFIISKDTARFVRHLLRPDSIWKGDRVAPERVSVMTPGDVWTDGYLTVRAFGSTDTGCSYGLECAGKRFFHAGDLNAWIWKDESTPAEVRAAIRDFDAITATIAEAMPQLDLAMFPVDSRIGRDWYEGAARFVRAISVARFIPMHFGLGESAEELARRAEDARCFSRFAAPRGEYIFLDGSSSLAFT